MRHHPISPTLRRSDGRLPSGRLTASDEDRDLSLTQAGLFFDICRSYCLVDRHGHYRSLRIVLFAWLPIVVASALGSIAGRPPAAIASDVSVHARLLVALPLLLIAERVLDRLCDSTVRVMHKEQRVPRAVITSIIERAARMRASRGVEGTLALVAFVSGQAALWGVWSPSGLVHAIERASVTSFATFWYTTIGLPLVQFLVLRWLWRWVVWSYVLFRFSRVDLATNGLHPDNAAGLKVLSSPVDAFAVFIASNSIVAAAVCAMQMREQHVALHTFLPQFLAFAVFAVVAACGPLLLFSGQIYRARKRDVERYHALASEYVSEFRCKWLASRGDQVRRTFAGLDGSADLQSFNGLDASFKCAEATRTVPFGARSLLTVAMAACLPLLPLMLSSMSLRDITRYLGRMLQLPFI
jgi:hypothetical protein